MRPMKEKQVEDLTSLPKRKEGIINTIAIINILSGTYIVICTCFLLVIEKELVSESIERKKEVEELQEIIMSLTLQLRERDKQNEEIMQRLKGNWYMSG